MWSSRKSLKLAGALVCLLGPSPSMAQVSSSSEGVAASSGEAAMAAFPLVYVVRYRPGPSYRADRPLLRQDLREHEAYMRSQTQAGIIIAAGPTFDNPGGLVLIRAATSAEAQAFIRSDPAVIAGIFAGEVTDWRPVFDAGNIFRSKPASGM